MPDSKPAANVVQAACQWLTTHERLMEAMTEHADAEKVKAAQFAHAGARLRLERRVRRYLELGGGKNG